MRIDSYGLTDRGRARARNEDQFLIAELTRSLAIRQSSLPEPAERVGQARGHLFLVADGVGGNAGGEQASALAIDAVEDFALNVLDWFQRPERRQSQRVLDELDAALHVADTRICDAAQRQPELRGMGTTVTLAYCVGSTLFVAHVGDSRCYLLRDDALARLTRDHTLLDDLVRGGVLSRPEAAGHELRHVLTNVVGGSKRGLDAEAHQLELNPGDELLLCSDGLTEMLPDDRIHAVLRLAEPRTICERLIAEANESGGRDNITVIVARFEREGESRGATCG
jgi:protein phosphatase